MEEENENYKAVVGLAMTIQERVLSCISNISGNPLVKLEHNLKKDLGIDSLDIIELSMDIEQEFGVDAYDVVEKFNIVQDIVDFIRHR